MKNLKLYVSACLLACSTMASAQFTTGNAGGGATTSAADTEGWSKIYASYDPMTVEYDWEGAKDGDFTGISFGFAKGFSISQSMPLFVEAGLGISYAWNSEDYDYEESKMSLLSLKVPVNLTYKFAIPNSNIVIAPYAGISMRFNLMGKEKVEYKDGGYGDYDDYEDYLDDYEDYFDDYEDYFDYYSASAVTRAGGEEDKEKEYDMFDEDEVGKDGVWKRFQIGWQIGANVEFNQFAVGVQYGKDFSEFAKKTKLSTLSISVGYKF